MRQGRRQHDAGGLVVLGTARMVGAVGSRIAITDTGGSGVPLVLLHGGTRTLADWAPVVGRLSHDELRVVCMDQRSHGASDDTGSWSLDDAVSDVRLVIDE